MKDNDNMKQESSEEDKLLDSIAKAILHDLRKEEEDHRMSKYQTISTNNRVLEFNEMKESGSIEYYNHQSSEEDKLLDPIAKSILRDLQQQEDTTHFNTDHLTPTIDVVTEDDVKCNPLELSPNELIHCQSAAEANAKNDNMGGQNYNWKENFKPSYSPTPIQPTLNPTITAEPTKSPVPPTASPSIAPTSSPTNSRKLKCRERAFFLYCTYVVR